MSNNNCGWSKWSSPGQPDGTPGQCALCGLHRTYGDVKRCMRGGPEQPEREPQRQNVSSIGDRLAGWLSVLSVKSGCGCTTERDRLNRMTTAEARSKAGEIARNMLGRVDKLTGIGGRLIQWAAFLFPATTLLGLRVLIRVVIFQENCAGFLGSAKAR